MAETPATPDRKPPRFPYVGVLLAATCLAAAVWTWMRHSYCWDVCVEDLVTRTASPEVHSWPPYVESPNRYMIGRYVLLRGSFTTVGGGHPSMLMCCRQIEIDFNDEPCGVWVFLGRETPRNRTLNGSGEYKGRVCETMGTMSEWWAIKDFDKPYVTGPWPEGLAVCATASRFHPASIAGLMVGAMGLFVLTLALGHWLRKWRAEIYRKQAAGRSVPTSSELHR